MKSISFRIDDETRFIIDELAKILNLDNDTDVIRFVISSVDKIDTTLPIKMESKVLKVNLDEENNNKLEKLRGDLDTTNAIKRALNSLYSIEKQKELSLNFVEKSFPDLKVFFTGFINEGYKGINGLITLIKQNKVRVMAPEDEQLDMLQLALCLSVFLKVKPYKENWIEELFHEAKKIKLNEKMKLLLRDFLIPLS